MSSSSIILLLKDDTRTDTRTGSASCELLNEDTFICHRRYLQPPNEGTFIAR